MEIRRELDEYGDRVDKNDVFGIELIVKIGNSVRATTFGKFG